MQPEPNFPEKFSEILQKVQPVLQRYFASEPILMGGGSVLQARWQHRISTDIDLFISTASYAHVIPEHTESLESDLHNIEGMDSRRSFVTTRTIYCEIDGTELTIMPSDSVYLEGSGFCVPNTQIETESNRSILSKKLSLRMVDSTVIEIRDLFDLYVAHKLDRESLAHAVSKLDVNDVAQISALLRSLPSSWLTETTKPLVGANFPSSSATLPELVADEIERVFNNQR